MNRRKKEYNCLKDIEYILKVFKETGRPKIILSKYRLDKIKECYLYWIALCTFLLNFGLVYYIFKDHAGNNIFYPITLAILGIHIYLFESIISLDYKDEYKLFGIEKYSAFKRSEYLHYIHFRKRIISDGKLDQYDVNRLVNWITAEDRSKFSSVYESPLFLTTLGGFITLIATSLAMIEVDTRKFVLGLIFAFALFLIFLPFVDFIRTTKSRPLKIRKFLEWLILDSLDITSNSRNNTMSSSGAELESEFFTDVPAISPSSVEDSKLSTPTEKSL